MLIVSLCLSTNRAPNSPLGKNMMRRYTPIVLLSALLAFGCDTRSPTVRNAAPASATPKAAALEGHSQSASPRYQLLQVTSPSGSLVLRLDTTTGETWRLISTPSYRWASVTDNLERVGTYDEKTKTVRWAVVTPGGRELTEMSREELLRRLSAYADSPPSVDPRDPLGIRTPAK